MASFPFDAEALLALPLFSGLSVSDIVHLRAHFDFEHHARGTHLFRRGAHGDALYVVLSGQVALENLLPGRTQLLALCGSGDWFGELALLTGGPRTADARVTVEATLLRVSRAGWTELSLISPRLFALICERLSRELTASNEPPRSMRRAVIACRDALAPEVTWARELEHSIRRQFPGREVHVVGLDGASGGKAALEREVAAILAPDALVLITGEEADDLADRRLERRSACEWRLEPAYAHPRGAIIRGKSPEAALDRVARHVAGGTIGLALGAGGAYGYAHLGLLSALEECGIPIDYVAGASMGAIIGSAIAAGLGTDRLVAFAESMATRFRSIVLRDLDLRGPALLKGTAVMNMLGELEELRNATFDDLLLPFVAIAMDVRTGEEVVLDEGPVLDGIRPSFAMPGIFPCCTLGERIMVDGAMVNPVPVDRVRALGADFVIASQPIPPLQRLAVDPVGNMLGRARRLATFIPIRRVRHAIETLDVSLRSFQALWHRLATDTAVDGDAIVRPDLREFWFLQFGKARAIFEEGRRCAEVALPRIQELLLERLGFDARPPREPTS